LRRVGILVILLVIIFIINSNTISFDNYTFNNTEVMQRYILLQQGETNVRYTHLMK